MGAEFLNLDQCGSENLDGKWQRNISTKRHVDIEYIVGN